MTVDGEGHLEVSAADLLAAVRADIDQAVNELALTGTPRAFATFREYRTFVETVAAGLQVHPRTIVIRGSAHLGFSTTPKVAKVWRPFRPTGTPKESPSDIDLAIVDCTFYERMDDEVQEWEARQGRPRVNSSDEKFWLRRQTLRRRWICPGDDALPPNTCVPLVRAMKMLSKTAFCGGAARPVKAYAYRDWWTLHQKCEFDLKELLDGIKKGALPGPELAAPEVIQATA